MSRDQILNIYFGLMVLYGLVAFCTLAWRFRKHINFASVQAAMAGTKKLEPEIAAKWEKETRIVTRISYAFVIGWVVLAFAL